MEENTTNQSSSLEEFLSNIIALHGNKILLGTLFVFLTLIVSYNLTFDKKQDFSAYIEALTIEESLGAQESAKGDLEKAQNLMKNHPSTETVLGHLTAQYALLNGDSLPQMPKGTSVQSKYSKVSVLLQEGREAEALTESENLQKEIDPYVYPLLSVSNQLRTALIQENLKQTEQAKKTYKSLLTNIQTAKGSKKHLLEIFEKNSNSLEEFISFRLKNLSKNNEKIN